MEIITELLRMYCNLLKLIIAVVIVSTFALFLFGGS